MAKEADVRKDRKDNNNNNKTQQDNRKNDQAQQNCATKNKNERDDRARPQ